ncbi:MAG TPA: hypothetical protein VFG22_01960 [Polyangiales bacterium]|nr:hypothetical protein [Polyangiales bacterium]
MPEQIIFGSEGRGERRCAIAWINHRFAGNASMALKARNTFVQIAAERGWGFADASVPHNNDSQKPLGETGQQRIANALHETFERLGIPLNGKEII